MNLGVLLAWGVEVVVGMASACMYLNALSQRLAYLDLNWRYIGESGARKQGSGKCGNSKGLHFGQDRKRTSEQRKS